MTRAPEIAVNPAGNAVEYRLAGQTFYLDPASVRLYCASQLAVAERVERIQAEKRGA